MKHTVPKLNDPSLLKTDVAYINGEWVKAGSGKTFEVHGESCQSISIRGVVMTGAHDHLMNFAAIRWKLDVMSEKHRRTSE